ncbi:MAG: hypothetical protein JWN04_6821 [Myxococcaceae bacterium]|nr:hypothetical protein [Myxococcaceae bacterium]
MPRSSKKKAAHRLFRPAADQLALISCAALVALLGALEPYIWLGALMNELGFHLALAAGLGALVAGVKRAWLVTLALLALAGFFAWPLLPLYRSTRPTPQAGPTLRVATAHLAGNALDEDTLLSWLARERPDAASLTGLKSDLPIGTRIGTYRVARGNADLRALLLVQTALVVPVRERPNEHPMLTVRAGHCQARTVGIELPPLGAYTALDARTRAIARVTELKSTPRSIWLGHLGSRAEAHDLSPFIAAHTLRDARLGHGRLATAPGSLGALGFPLSHVLVHGWISVRSAEVKEPIVAGAQRTISAVLELTEARCRFTPSTPLE